MSGEGAWSEFPSERELRERILDVSPIPIAVLDRDARVVVANRRARTELGLEEDELVGLSAETAGLELFDEDLEPKDPEQAVSRRVLRTGEPIRGEVTYAVLPNGESMWISSSGAPLPDGSGEVVGAVIAFEDVTERIERERELREERAFTESMLGGVPDVFYAYDTDGTFLRWNDRFAEVTGYADGEIAEMEPLEFVPDDESERISGAIASILEDGEAVVVESYFLTSEGERVPYEFKAGPWRDRDGEIRGVIGIGRDVTERKERQRRFEAIFNQTFQFTGLLDPDGTLLEANDTALEFGGLEPEDVIGKKVWETYWFQIDEGTPERVREDVERAAEGQFVRYDLEVQGAEGPAVIDFSIKPITDEHGEIDLLIPEGRDITELKRREEELREERAFTESVLSGLPDVLYAFDNNGSFLRWNDRLSEVTGYADGEIAEMEPLEFVPDDEAGKIAENIAAVVDGGEAVTVESYFETKDGERIPYEFTGAPLVDQEGTELGLVGIGRDITERKERERRFGAVFNNTYQFTGLMEPDGTLLEANETALAFAGVDREDVVGRHLADTAWIREDETGRIREAVDRAREGEFVRFEMEINGGEGPAVIDFSLKPVTDEHGEVDLLIPEGRDITELKRREEELAEKTEELERAVDRLERTNAELEQFAYVASHDIQEPLRMISSYLDLLEAEYGDVLDEDAEEYIDFVVDGAARMREMIDDLLEFSRVQTREDEFDRRAVGDVLEAALDNLALAVEESDATITCDDLPVVSVDDHQLRQLFQNLIENAIHYAGDGPPRIHVAAEERADAWHFTVKDEGVGIPEAEQERIFDIFMRGTGTTDDAGSGIGLAICKRVVENHDGRIWVDSEQGRGTTVHFTLAKAPGRRNGGVV